MSSARTPTLLPDTRSDASRSQAAIDELIRCAAVVNGTPEPRYYQIAKAVKHALLRFPELEGARLPSEAELCGHLDAARGTVHRAIEMLIDDGLIEQRRGIGTFVTTSPGPDTPAPSSTRRALYCL